ncbi:MAG: DUF6600 domain-containing protein [Terracidiphilus sp.]|jgi:hypothetical protein
MIRSKGKGWPGIGTLGLALLAAGLLLPVALRADDAAPISRAIRLSSVEGHVRIAQGSQLLADSALQNTPIFEGSQILTSDDGQAELQLDDGSVVRLSPNSSLTIAHLRGQAGGGDAEIVLNNGLAYFELQGESASNHIRISFGDTVVTADGFTVIRINLDNPPGELAVFSGNAHLVRGSASSGVSIDMHGGESVSLSAADPAQYNLAESIEPDSWDAWNSDRDQSLLAAEASRTGAANDLPESNNPAWNDLDANGAWYNVPGQGEVWSPYDASSSSFDPYGNGYWMSTPNFGYIWISGYSWGYMPYQCGAWNFFDDFGWGWAPGGCSPWWGSGLWISNIGGHRPRDYRFPLRPHPGPPRGPARPLRGGFRAPENQIVAVNRHFPSTGGNFPARSRSGPVTIAGQEVRPLRPIASRPFYAHSFSSSSSAEAVRPTYSGGRPATGERSTFTSPSGSPSGFRTPGETNAARPYGLGASGVPRPAGTIARPSATVSRPASSPARSAPPASHVSSGGGGGAHVSGGSHR